VGIIQLSLKSRQLGREGREDRGERGEKGKEEERRRI